MAEAAYANAYQNALDGTTTEIGSNRTPPPGSPMPPPAEGFGSLLAKKAAAQDGKRGYGLTPELKSRMTPLKGSPYSFTVAKAGPKHVVVVGLHDHRGEVVRHGVFGWQELEDHAATAPYSEFVGHALDVLRPRTEGKVMAKATKYDRGDESILEKDGHRITVTGLNEKSLKILQKMGWKPLRVSAPSPQPQPQPQPTTATAPTAPPPQPVPTPPPTPTQAQSRPQPSPPSSSPQPRPTPTPPKPPVDPLSHDLPTAIGRRLKAFRDRLEGKAEHINDLGYRLQDFIEGIPGRIGQSIKNLDTHFYNYVSGGRKPSAPTLADVISDRMKRHASLGIYRVHPKAITSLKPKPGSNYSASVLTNKGGRRYVFLGHHDDSGRPVSYGVFGHQELSDLAKTHPHLQPLMADITPKLRGKRVTAVAKYSRTILDI